MSQGFIKAIDEGIIGQFLNRAVESGFGIPWVAGKALEGVNKLAEVTTEVAGVVGKLGVASLALGSSIGRDDSPMETPVRQKELEISAPPTNKHEVAMSELGSFSAPTFGGCSRGGAGIGM